MGFSISDIIVLLVVIIILAVYRSTDRNNRSLEKVKRFVDRMQGEMDTIVAEKVTMLKDIGIEVDVHQKAAKEVLKRVIAIEEDLSGRIDRLETIGDRLSEYEQSLNQLMSMTNQAEENIARVRDESAYIDTVGKRIKVTRSKIEELEQSLPAVVSGFEKQNSDRLAAVEERLFQDVNTRVGDLQGRVETADGRVQGFSEEVARLQGEMDSQVQQARSELDDLYQQLLAGAHEEVAALVNGSRQDLEEHRRQIEEFRQDTELRFEEVRESAQGHVTELDSEVHRVLQDAQERLKALGETGRSWETESLASVRGYVDRESAAIRSELDQELARVRTHAEELATEALRTVEGDISRSVEAHRNHLEESFDALQRRAAEEQASVQERFETLQGEVERWVGENRSTIETVRQQVVDEQESLREHVGTLDATVSQNLADLEERVRTEVDSADQRMSEQQRRMTNQFDALQQRFDADVAEIREISEQTTERMTAAREQLEAQIEQLRSRVLEMTADLGNRIDGQAHTLEQTVLRDIEARLDDYEKQLNYRFSKVEAVNSDIDDLEQNLRATMDRIAERVRGDFMSFGEEIRGEREQDRQEAQAAIQVLRDSMAELESGLNDLKQQAYDSVSEKLKVFEDEFFTDLRDRSAAMEDQIDHWRDEVTQRLSTIQTEEQQARSELEKNYGEQMRQRLSGFQETINGQLNRLDEQIGTFRNGIESRIEATELHLGEIETSLKEEVESLGERSRQSFRQEFSQTDERMRGELKEFATGLEAEVEAARQQAQQGRQAIEEMVEAARSDVAVWQTEVLNQLRSSNADVNNQLADAKVRLSENLQDLKREFVQEKESLVNESLEERQRARSNLDSLTTGVQRLEEALQNRSDQAIEEFEDRFAALQQRASQHERDISERLEERSNDLRNLVSNTRDQFQAMREKLLGKLEEESSVLSTTLQEIDKRQKAFVEQTQIFERADSLQVSLEQNIEELRQEIGRVEAMRNDVRDIEGQFAKIRKLSSEAGEKMARFTADKRRIDLLEEDYRRLIGLAHSVEEKIQQVGESDEQVQEITARLQSMDDLQREVETRFDRLEKRRSVVDQTTQRLEENAQAVGEIDRQVKELMAQMDAMPGQIADLSGQLKQVGAQRKEAESALSQLSRLDETLNDVERRMQELQTAREWLARTETRLEEIRREAGEQVKLLGSIMREESKKNPDGAGAPSMTARETVQKLAHQGWNVDEIARATKVSKGEVELILELTSK